VGATDVVSPGGGELSGFLSNSTCPQSQVAADDDDDVDANAVGSLSYGRDQHLDRSVVTQTRRQTDRRTVGRPMSNETLM